MDPDDVSNPTDNELAEILLGFNPIPVPVPVPVPVPDQPLAIPAAAANPLPNTHPVQLLGNGQIPSIYTSFQDYLSTCSHLGCRIQISDENSAYCCTEHLNLASNIAPGNSYALHYIGGFEDVQEMQRCCVIGIYNKLRNIGIGVPTLDTGTIFSTLPWEQHLVFNTTVVGNCAWLFFTQPPECYPLMGNQRMKWDLKNRKDVSIFANQNPVSMRPLNLRSYRASAEVMERSRGWNLYLFESGPEALYCLTFSNRQRRIRKSTPKLESSLIDANKESQPPATKKLKSGPKDVHGQELTVLNKGISNVGGGSSRNKLQRIMEFLHYCHSLTSESGQNCSLVVLNHEDIYSIMEISANGVIKAEPLASGLVNEVHGQVLPWNSYTTIASSRHKLQKFLLKIMEFLHYYHSLTSESGQNCLLVILNHEDIYLIMERPAFYRWYALQMDGVIKAEPLSLKFK